MDRIDDVLGYKNLKIYQNSSYFSFSLDSIVLANYATIRLRDRSIVDFCTGNGVVPLILSRRTSNKIIGVELQEKIAKLAKDSVSYNNLDNQIEIFCEDIKDFSKKNSDSFDLVLCNPPYFKVTEGTQFNISYEKMVARHEVFITLSDLCACAKKILKDHGNFCLIHRSDRLMDILIELKKNNIEPKKIKFIYETIEKESFLVLIEGQKCGKTGLKIEKPLILYNKDGSITDEYKLLQEEVRV
ncbi:MAG: tRNA1(Val) (adenine(37)-N6)-methyltransferase [Bacilli bacterium]|nr:tRNA1(Val) (adenine(37)-N6)-methyltransferase [Bacilli bacterium]